MFRSLVVLFALTVSTISTCNRHPSPPSTSTAQPLSAEAAPEVLNAWKRSLPAR